MPGAHKIGAAISGPRLAGGNFMDTTLFLIDKAKVPTNFGWPLRNTIVMVKFWFCGVMACIADMFQTISVVVLKILGRAIHGPIPV